ncbi:MAG: hypothetical protein ACYC64_17790 [Armatimonadota bacterium]
MIGQKPFLVQASFRNHILDLIGVSDLEPQHLSMLAYLLFTSARGKNKFGYISDAIPVSKETMVGTARSQYPILAA